MDANLDMDREFLDLVEIIVVVMMGKGGRTLGEKFLNSPKSKTTNGDGFVGRRGEEWQQRCIW